LHSWANLSHPMFADDWWYSCFRVVSLSVRDLAIHIDTYLVIRTLVQKTVSCCFRQLHQIRRSVPQPTFQLLVVTLVNSRLDYVNGTSPPILHVVCSQFSTKLRGWFSTCVAPTMSLTHSSAFTGCVFLSASGPKSPFWCTRSSMAVHRHTLACSLTLPTLQVAEDFALPAETNSTNSFSLWFTFPLLAAEHFRLLAFRCGTACHRRLHRHCLWRPSALDSRRSCSLSHILTFGWSDILCLHTIYGGSSSVLNT